MFGVVLVLNACLMLVLGGGLLAGYLCYAPFAGYALSVEGLASVWSKFDCGHDSDADVEAVDGVGYAVLIVYAFSVE